MNRRLDSAHIIAALGTMGGFLLTNFDRIAAALCALGGLAYTVWKWRREARRSSHRRSLRSSAEQDEPSE